MRNLVLIISLALAPVGFGAETVLSIATLNCYWFFNGNEGNGKSGKPRTNLEYSTKAGHLIGLLPAEAPLFVGFEEIGGGEDVTALAESASARYGHQYRTLFARGKVTATGQNVGVTLHLNRGWGVCGRPSRVSDLERELTSRTSKSHASAKTWF